mgnify:CR=1 FL=1
MKRFLLKNQVRWHQSRNKTELLVFLNNFLDCHSLIFASLLPTFLKAFLMGINVFLTIITKFAWDNII